MLEHIHRKEYFTPDRFQLKQLPTYADMIVQELYPIKVQGQS